LVALVDEWEVAGKAAHHPQAHRHPGRARPRGQHCPLEGDRCGDHLDALGLALGDELAQHFPPGVPLPPVPGPPVEDVVQVDVGQQRRN
jgi:hypothetical protein